MGVIPNTVARTWRTAVRDPLLLRRVRHRRVGGRLPMTFSDALTVIVGVSAIVIGCVGKTFYYAKGLNFASASDKRAPTWQGHAMFIGVGILFLAIELERLFFFGH